MKTKGVILIVDNAPEFLDSLKLFLEVKGYTVYTADNPVDAKRLLTDELIHLAVIDVRLTDDRAEDDWSGLHLAAEAAPDVPKIILTGRRYEDPSALVLQVLRPDKQGHILASVFVFKKEGPDKLLEAIEAVFQSKVRLNTELEITWEKGLSCRVLVEELEVYRGKSEDEKGKAEEELEDLVVRLVDRATALRMLRIISGRGGCGVIIARPSFGGVMGENMVIKFGLRETVMTEFDNYKRWVEPFAAVRCTQLRGEPVRTLHLGAIKYSFVGERAGRLVHFNDYYLRDDVPIESIEKTLRYLFEECCELWYKSKRRPGEKERIPLDVWYREQLPFYERHVEELQDVVEGLVNGEQPLARHFRRQRPDRLEVTLGDETISLPDPVHFALEAKSSERGEDFFPVPSLVAITHGDLDGTNILVDREGKAWLIDFSKTGWGPALRDLAEMESVVKFELLQTDSLLVRLDLERALLAPRMFDERVQFENRARVPELDKAIAAIRQLRELARRLTDTNDMYEYYIGLLFYALKEMAGFTSRVGEGKHVSVSQYHALLSAAMVCQKLQQREFSNAGITRRFFQQAGFAMKQLSDASLSASYPTKGGWRRYGAMYILCVDGDVSGSDISAVVSKARGEGTLDGGLAFIVHSGKLVENAARQLWELKEERFIIVPIHISTLNELLARSEQVCYAKLMSLRDDWSTMSDPYASIDSSDPQWFVGRKQRIRSALDSIDQSKAVGIFGMRRIGKTLLLNQLHTACYRKGYPVTMLACTPESSLSALLHGIVEGLAHCAKDLYPRLVLPELDTKTDQDVADAAVRFRTDLTRLEEAVSRVGAYGTKFVVLLDEIDHIVPTEESTEQDYRRYVEFFQAIKSVAESSDFLSVVVAGYSPAIINGTDRFPAQPQFENPMYDRFNEIRLPLMVKEESDEIVQNLGALAGLEYVEESLQEVYEEAQGHPEITRKLCSCVLAEQIESGAQPGIVTSDVVDSAVRRFLSDPRYTFYLNETYWKSLLLVNADLKKLILFALAKASCSKEQIVSQAVDWLTAFLPHEDAIEEIESALVSLEELGLISRENSQYRIGIHLLLRWIRQDKLKEDPSAPAGGG